MLSVAFFRNLNQGQKASPSGAVLLEAFEESGATAVSAYRGNGTVIFDTDDPQACAEAVPGLLERLIDSPVTSRGLSTLAGLAGRLSG